MEIFPATPGPRAGFRATRPGVWARTFAPASAGTAGPERVVEAGA